MGPGGQRDNKGAALAYAKAGWAVFPLIPGKKKPATVNGFHEATRDAAEITEVWGAHPDCGIGIATGKVSGGLVVLDFDVHPEKGEDGLETLHEWEREHGDLPETVTVVTGSGGYHMYYYTDEPHKCAANGELGVDIRANGGYVVAPPTLHPNGTYYEWENDPEEYAVARADANVLAFIDYVRPRGGEDGQKFEMPDRIGSGSRDDTLFKLACSLRAKDVPMDEIMAALQGINVSKCDPPMTEAEVERIVKNVCTRYEGGTSEAKELPPVSGEDSEDYDIPIKLMTRKGSGEPIQNLFNCRTVIAMHPHLANRFFYDERSYTVMCRLPLPWDKREGNPRQVTDVDYAYLKAFMERYYKLSNKQNVIDAVSMAAHDNRCNQVVEYLQGLEWDGTPRIRTAFSVFLGAEMNDYNAEASALAFLGGVARAVNPGCKFDYVVVLVGPQGIGKSWFVRKMAVRTEWFGDGINTFSGDAAVEKLRGVWIGEASEMLALKATKEVEGVKAFITTQYDIIRPKYARETEQRPRACIIMGTTNDAGFLTDSTGNRRFLPIECRKTEPPMALDDPEADAFFEQCWAEAYSVYTAQCPKLVLSARAQAYATEMQETYTEDDPRVGIIQRRLDEKVLAFASVTVRTGTKNGRLEEGLRVCVREVVEKLPDDYRNAAATSRGANQIHNIFRNKIRGWEGFTTSEGKPSKAKCGEYGIQRCYVPTEECWQLALRAAAKDLGADPD